MNKLLGVSTPTSALSPLHSAIKNHLEFSELNPHCCVLKEPSLLLSVHLWVFPNYNKIYPRNSTARLFTERGMLYPEKWNSIPDPS